MIIDGRQISKDMVTAISQEIAVLTFKPLLVDVLVGNDSVSRSYVEIKRRISERAGFEFRCLHFESKVTPEEILKKMEEIQQNPALCGMIVQVPTPDWMDSKVLIEAINPRFDVDVLGSVQSSKFYSGAGSYAPPTASAVLAIFQTLPQNLQAGTVVLVGKGKLVGRPTAQLLKNLGIPFVAVDNMTPDITTFLRSADVIISGVGKQGLIQGSMIKPGCAIIDAGTSEDEGTIAGDVNFESASGIAGYITPTPGGVGPVTVACLLKNVLEVAKTKMTNDKFQMSNGK